MIRLIALRDFVEKLRDGRLVWAGSVVLILLLTALGVGYGHQREARAEQAAAQSSDYEGWLHQGHRHPHDAAHQGMHAFKPDPALAIVDPGINPYIGSTVWLQAHRQSEVKFRPAQDATGLQRFGELSVSWILQVLGPLLVIVLGFNAFSGEREQGVHRQTLSLGVPPMRLLWGKALALGMSLCVLLVPAALVAAGAVMMGAEVGTHWDALARFLAFAAGYALYLAIFVFITLGVSAASSTSRVAITILLAVWIANAVVAPRVMSEVSRVLLPSPTRLEFNKALSDDLKATSDRVWMESFGTTQRWGADVPLNKWGIALKLDDQASYAVYDRHFGRLWDTWERQQSLQELAGLVLPSVAKGPASVLYGDSAIGGIVNFQTKRPDRNNSGREALLSYGSYGSYRAALGLGGAVGDSGAYRLDYSRNETKVGTIDRNSEKLDHLTTGLSFDVSRDTKLDLSFDYTRDDGHAYWGTPLVPASFATEPTGVVSTPDGRVIDRQIARNNYNILDDKNSSEGYWLRARITSRITPQWTVRNEIAANKVERYWRNAETAVFVAPGQIQRDQTIIAHDQRYIFNRLDASHEGQLAGLKNKFVVGAEISKTDFDNSVLRENRSSLCHPNLFFRYDCRIAART